MDEAIPGTLYDILAKHGYLGLLVIFETYVIAKSTIEWRYPRPKDDNQTGNMIIHRMVFLFHSIPFLLKILHDFGFQGRIQKL